MGAAEREVSAVGTHATAGNTAAVAAHAAAGIHCANCGAAVTGKFCSECGQRVEHSVHSVWHFTLEATEDLTHADSRLWRTMGALLLKPGYLTSEFLAGRRMSYMPPIRLYLVLSLLFFLITSITRDPATHVLFVDRAGHEVFSQQAAESRHERAEKACAKLLLRTSCLKAVEDDGHRLVEAYTHNLPRAIFLMVPILALVMKPLYLRQRRHYVEHALFILHDHSFVFLLFGLLAVVAALLKFAVPVTPLAIAAGLYIPFYYYRGMRRVYGEGPARTVGKLVVLSIAYLITATLVLIGTGLYSALSQ
jgi:hypothetical protein